MFAPGMLALTALAAVLLVPLAREYADLRRSSGLSRLRAFATTSLVFPAFGVAVALTLPLSAYPPAHWIAIVVTTLVLYSAAANGLVRTVAGQALNSRP